MTVISDPPRRPTEDEPSHAPAPTPAAFAPPPKMRRRPMLIAASVAAVTVGAAVSAWAYSAVSDSHSVLAVRTTVERGQIIERADLMSASISVDPALHPLSVDQASAVIGKRAALDMPAGSVVTAEQVSDQLVPPAGQSVVGISLAPGLLPTDLLQVGAPVRVVSTPGEGGGQDEVSPTATSAIVVGISTDSVSGNTLVNVQVPAVAAPAVAAAAATGKVALIADSQER